MTPGLMTGLSIGALFFGGLFVWGRYCFKVGYKIGADETSHAIGVRMMPLFAQAGIQRDVIMKAIRGAPPTN